MLSCSRIASATPAAHTFALGAVVGPVSRGGLTVTLVSDLQVLTRRVVPTRTPFLALVHGLKQGKQPLQMLSKMTHFASSLPCPVSNTTFPLFRLIYIGAKATVGRDKDQRKNHFRIHFHSSKLSPY